MRNKIILAMAATGMMCATSAFAAGDVPIPADAGGGKITFSGSVIEAPCSILPDSQNIQVSLGEVSTKSLSENGRTSPDPAKIQINLSGCAFEESLGDIKPNPDYGQKSKADVEFSNYTAITAASGIIKNMDTVNPAQNVNIQLLRSDMQPLNLTAAVDGKNATQLTPGKNSVTFWAQMVASGQASQGNVGATITYKMKYF